MFEILGTSASTVLGGLGALAAVVSIIVEMSKAFIPKKVPTALVTILVSMIVCVAFVLLFFEVTVKALVLGFFMSFIVAYTSMNGFDTLTKLWKRFQFVDKIEEDDSE